MTRKHFEGIAKALNQVRPYIPDHVENVADFERANIERDAWVHCVASIAQYLQSQNGRFDYGRFIAACDFEPEPMKG